MTLFGSSTIIFVSMISVENFPEIVSTVPTRLFQDTKSRETGRDGTKNFLGRFFPYGKSLVPTATLYGMATAKVYVDEISENACCPAVKLRLHAAEKPDIFP